MPGRERLDQLLVARGLADSRSKAQALVLAGQVRSDGVRLEKVGVRYPLDIPLEVLAGPRWVSRAGHKLEHALAQLDLEVRDRDALDVGASTGGFTQVLLASGARSVIALDVGRGQLDWNLRRDPRVRLLEGVNARHLRPDDLPRVPEVAVIDVSFISLRLVLPAVVACLAHGGRLVALVKPQFEVGRRQVPRGGVVRDPRLHRGVLADLVAFCGERNWGVVGLCGSGLPGAEGNLEFFLCLAPGSAGLKPSELRRRIDTLIPQAESPPP